jgi:uncharacterized protein YcbK (DUF882 family)
LRAIRLARHSACVAALGSTVAASALAQPPSRGGAARATHTTAARPAATARPGSAAALAYLSGKQALVGLHAPSTRPVARDASGRPMLTLTNVNRGETLSVAVLGDDGGFDSADLDRVAHLLRAASGDEHPIDPRTLLIAYRVQTHFDVPEIRVVSGYRVPGPGSHSNHNRGRAIDMIVPGVPDIEVARYVREIGFVGVGVYPTSQFVHVDIRPHSYFWVDYTGPHMKSHDRGILGDLAAQSDAAALARGQPPVEPYVVRTDVDAALRSRGVDVASQPADEQDEDD